MYRTDSERDIFNEKPSKEEQMAATQVSIGKWVWPMGVAIDVTVVGDRRMQAKLPGHSAYLHGRYSDQTVPRVVSSF